MQKVMIWYLRPSKNYLSLDSVPLKLKSPTGHLLVKTDDCMSNLREGGGSYNKRNKNVLHNWLFPGSNVSDQDPDWIRI